MSKPGGLSVLLLGCSEEMVRAVRDGGHQTAAPATPMAGIAQARETVLDVVVLDLDAGDDPFDLARGIRAVSLWRKPMFVALTERSTEELNRRCEKAGIDLLLIKPVEPNLVAEFLTRLDAVVQDYESFDPVI